MDARAETVETGFVVVIDGEFLVDTPYNDMFRHVTWEDLAEATVYDSELTAAGAAREYGAGVRR